MEKYGGIAGWHKHNVEERPLLEKEGWHARQNTQTRLAPTLHTPLHNMHSHVAQGQTRRSAPTVGV